MKHWQLIALAFVLLLPACKKHADEPASDDGQWVCQETSWQTGYYRLAHVPLGGDALLLSAAWKSNQQITTHACSIRQQDSLYYLNPEGQSTSSIYHLEFRGTDSVRIYSLGAQVYVSPEGNTDSTFWHWLEAGEHSAFLYASQTDGKYKALTYRAGTKQPYYILYSPTTYKRNAQYLLLFPVKDF